MDINRSRWIPATVHKAKGCPKRLIIPWKTQNGGPRINWEESVFNKLGDESTTKPSVSTVNRLLMWKISTLVGRLNCNKNKKVKFINFLSFYSKFVCFFHKIGKLVFSPFLKHDVNHSCLLLSFHSKWLDSGYRS